MHICAAALGRGEKVGKEISIPLLAAVCLVEVSIGKTNVSISNMLDLSLSRPGTGASLSSCSFEW